MAVYLVRHAIAVSRSSWHGRDEDRPLTKRGERQAEGLIDLLARAHVRRIHSSPSERCRATVDPLSDKLNVPIRAARELAEGGPGDDAFGFLVRTASKKGDAVLCTHGDVVPQMLRRLSSQGVHLPNSLRWAKGSVWVLEWDGDRFTDGHYQAPPA